MALGVRALQAKGKTTDRALAKPLPIIKAADAAEVSTETPKWLQVAPLAYCATSTTSAPPRSAAVQPPNAEEPMAKLRREQLAFKRVVREESRRNSWLAIPALAPVAAVLIGEGAELLGAGLAAARFKREAQKLAERRPEPTPESPQPSTISTRAAKPRPDAEDNELRRIGRKRFARANGVQASDLDAYVHHRVALRFRNLFPNADPNRLANLQGLEQQAHYVVTQATEAWVRSLGGRTPKQAEVMAHVLEMDKLVEPYIVRAGVSRPLPKP